MSRRADWSVTSLTLFIRGPDELCVVFRLSGCVITEEGCASLASALSSNPTHLRVLDLSFNHPGDSAVKLLRAGLEDPRWRLSRLRYEEP